LCSAAGASRKKPRITRRRQARISRTIVIGAGEQHLLERRHGEKALEIGGRKGAAALSRTRTEEGDERRSDESGQAHHSHSGKLRDAQQAASQRTGVNETIAVCCDRLIGGLTRG
jgi:hypothetical protein